MKRALIGLAAVGAIVGVRRAKRMGQKMREHCKQMAAQYGTRGERVGRT
jgi:hypothetical protein